MMAETGVCYWRYKLLPTVSLISDKQVTSDWLLHYIHAPERSPWLSYVFLIRI